MIDTRDDSRKVQRIWYVDLLNKVVWDAESLGQKYGANGIQERCITDEEYRQRQKEEQALTYRQRQRHY
ncbi:hypothetical protein ACQ86N_38995 [Puia sp. P3]|uniref:hypothetical protein n=1 Tax=Puia sp. P3 TaxID=3423952 RepID=UPI003D67453B